MCDATAQFRGFTADASLMRLRSYRFADYPHQGGEEHVGVED